MMMMISWKGSSRQRVGEAGNELISFFSPCSFKLGCACYLARYLPNYGMC